MTKIVNSWNEWDLLKRVIVGRPEGTNIAAPEPGRQIDNPKGGFPLPTYGPLPQEMVDAANEQMDYFVSVLEKRGVKIDRPVVHPCMFNRPVSTPDWTQLNCFGCNEMRDVFMCHGNCIIEAPCSYRSRWYEYLNLRPLFEQYFKEDPELVWFTAPKPRLTGESYEKNYYYNYNNVWTYEEKKQRLYDRQLGLTEKEPLWDAADCMRFGKDIFHNCSSCGSNRAGHDWLKRMFAEFGIRVHCIEFEPTKPEYFRTRHIDGEIFAPRPGLALYCPENSPRTSEFWDLFKKNGWELIPSVSATHVHKSQLAATSWPLIGTVDWATINSLAIDPKTVCVEAHETAYCEQLDKLGFEVIPIPYEKAFPFGGSFHCTTLDICREGKLEDYFPKQIGGY